MLQGFVCIIIIDLNINKKVTFIALAMTDLSYWENCEEIRYGINPPGH